MTQSYITGSIGTATLESSGGDPCKVMLVDGAGLLSPFAINVRVSAGGSAYTQIVPLSAIPFGLSFEFCPPELLAEIIEIVNAALASQEPFEVELQDDIHTVHALCMPDGSKWLSYPKQRTNEISIKDVVMRFITTSFVEEEP